ncbi:hypothetical protein FJY63_03110 [Candidatus Sumerlaeota bacterium]|nr:hypothetical protein [Candidatus Sumerlaeota bacterium]
MSRKTKPTVGFTLIEILVIVAIISLLAGLAGINVQRAYQDNQRKAAYGEGRAIATALAFAYKDITIYPKLCFLQHNVLYLAPPQTAMSTRPGSYLVSGFEYLGYDINRTLPVLVSRVIKNWSEGTQTAGYFALGQRAGLFQGRGGLVRMEVPTAGYNPVVLGMAESQPIYDWPADPWGNPYVVYMLYLAGVDFNGLPVARFPDSPMRKPNYAFAVVSYGPNGVPGGSENVPDTDRPLAQALRLYTQPTLAGARFRCLYPQDYSATVMGIAEARAKAWSFEKLMGLTGPLAYPGITDEGSDDIVVPVP